MVVDIHTHKLVIPGIVRFCVMWNWRESDIECTEYTLCYRCSTCQCYIAGIVVQVLQGHCGLRNCDIGNIEGLVG